MNLEQFNNPMITKKDISDYIQHIESQVKDEEIDALELKVVAARLSEFIKQINASKVITKYAVDEREKWGDKELCKVMGCKIEKRETGVKYDYSKSLAWAKAKEQQNIANAKMNEVQTIAKVCKSSSSWVNRETGEEYPVVPATKTSTTNVVISLPKD